MKPKPKKYRKSRNTTPSSTAILEVISLQEEFAPYRGRCAAGVVARVEGLRARMSEARSQAPCRACRDIEGLFESLLAEVFA